MPDSSLVIEQVANDTEASVCADLRPATITREQFNDGPQWSRDYILQAAAAWKARCGV
ncbi:MAG: hypothetical protein MK130_05125 [Puniceicoccaceae bacterium]|nr:hypothetical protein [Puniceicoccaceae bacterium]